MALSAKQIEIRSKGIGASDARTIATGGGKEWKALYDEKINGIQPKFTPDQLYLMSMGVAIEPLTLKRFGEKVTPLKPLPAQHTVHWKTDPFFLFTPDGITAETDVPVQAKFHTGDKNILELADYYMPQLLHEMLCTGAKHCWLAVTFGHYGRFMHQQVERNEDALDGYLQRAMQFKQYLETGEMPVELAGFDAPPVPRKRDHVWMAGDNTVGPLAVAVLENYESSALFDEALAELKKLFPKDAATGTWVDPVGRGIKMTADRAGKIRWVPLFPGMSAVVQLLDAMLEALAVAVEMRVAQKTYFRERTTEALVASKQLEKRFDAMAIAITDLRRQTDGNPGLPVPGTRTERPDG